MSVELWLIFEYFLNYSSDVGRWRDGGSSPLTCHIVADNCNQTTTFIPFSSYWHTYSSNSQNKNNKTRKLFDSSSGSSKRTSLKIALFGRVGSQGRCQTGAEATSGPSKPRSPPSLFSCLFHRRSPSLNGDKEKRKLAKRVPTRGSNFHSFISTNHSRAPRYTVILASNCIRCDVQWNDAAPSVSIKTTSSIPNPI